jgi:protein involved in polysaccharide export with SLBB domain
MSRTRRASAVVLLVTNILLLLPAFPASAQPASAQPASGDRAIYRIGPGDVLRLNVPAAAQLERDLTVQPDGTIYIPQVGAVAVGGLPLAEAEELVFERVRLFNPQVDSVILVVVEYNALRVFVLGAVRQPGAYTFATSPTVWEVLRAAGGPAESANLAAARLIVTRNGKPSSQTINISGYLSGASLPEQLLEAGDTLVVPTIADGIVGVGAGQGVQVFGGVGTPTTVPLTEPTPLLTVLMLAGAPVSDAKLDEIAWVHDDGSGSNPRPARVVNLKEYLEKGLIEGNPSIGPGDAIYLPQERPGWLAANLPLFLGVLTSVTTTFLVVDRIQN